MLSIHELGLRKVHAHLQQLAANRLSLSAVVVILTWGSLMGPARAETAVAVPSNGRIPAGFHDHRPPFLRGRRGAGSCGPKVALKRFKRRECRKPRCAAQGVDVDDTGALVDDSPLRNVIVTGANRGLGFAIADRMLDIGGYRVVLACRSQQEGEAALERLRVKQQQQQQQQQQGHHGTLPTTVLASVHPLDVSCPRSLESFRENCVHGHLGGRVDILFNNAGVCLAEDGKNGTKTRSTVATAAGILRETFAVNFFGALGVAEACMPALVSAGTTPTAVEAGIATTAGKSYFAAVAMPLTPPTVVWISSGEGELCFLGAKWRRLLANAASLEEIISHMSQLLASASASEKNANGNSSRDSAGEQQEEGEEMAFGPTPAYSLSKAAANAAVRTWAPRLLRPATAPTSGSSTGSVVAGVRLVAVCPGDVLTRMTSAEELTRGGVVSAEEAAAAVVKIALGSAHEFPAGKFYRHCEEIGW